MIGPPTRCAAATRPSMAMISKSADGDGATSKWITSPTNVGWNQATRSSMGISGIPTVRQSPRPPPPHQPSHQIVSLELMHTKVVDTETVAQHDDVKRPHTPPIPWIQYTPIDPGDEPGERSPIRFRRELFTTIVSTSSTTLSMNSNTLKSVSPTDTSKS